MTTATAENLGHNRPPPEADPIRERLESDYRDLLARQCELLEGFERAPEAINDDNAGLVSDFTKQIAACIKTMEKTRVAEKEPYLAAGRSVDAFFKKAEEPLEKAKKVLTARLTTYEREKEAAERKRREEEARKAREAEEAARKAAEEAAAKLESDDDLESAIEAEARAKQIAADAAKAQKEAAAKAAEMSRTRGDGSMSSLRTFWDFDSLNRDTLDLEALRPFIPQAALEQAVRGFIRAGGRQLRGVRIFENTSAVVR